MSPTQADLIALALICLQRADVEPIKSVAAELRTMARDYRRRAAAFEAKPSRIKRARFDPS
jgi:hypothetical protein